MPGYDWSEARRQERRARPDFTPVSCTDDLLKWLNSRIQNSALVVRTTSPPVIIDTVFLHVPIFSPYQLPPIVPRKQVLSIKRTISQTLSPNANKVPPTWDAAQLATERNQEFAQVNDEVQSVVTTYTTAQEVMASAAVVVRTTSPPLDAVLWMVSVLLLQRGGRGRSRSLLSCHCRSSPPILGQ